MPCISQSEKSKSDEFMELLQDLLSIVDEFSELIGDGNYLNCCNLLDKIRKAFPGEEPTPLRMRVYIQSLALRTRSTEIYRTHDIRRNMPLRKRERDLTDAEKMNDRQYTRCVKCDRLMMKCNLDEHHRTHLCHRILETKSISSSTGQVDTTDYTKSIILIRKWCIKTGRSKKFF